MRWKFDEAPVGADRRNLVGVRPLLRRGAAGLSLAGHLPSTAQVHHHRMTLALITPGRTSCDRGLKLSKFAFS